MFPLRDLWTPSNTWFLRPIPLTTPHSISTALAVFAEYMVMTEKLTDGSGYKTCSNSHYCYITDGAIQLKRAGTSISVIVYRLQNEYARRHAHTTVLWPTWILSRTTWVSQYQKGKTRKVKPI